MPATTKPIYDCTQRELISTSRTIVQSMEDNLAAFTAYKAKYDAAFVAARRARIDAAEAMPDEEMRSGAGELLRVQLIPLNRTCLNDFQDLKGYIDDVFLKDERKSQYEMAGARYYEQGLNENWESTKQMTVNMNIYIAANTVFLSNGGTNMPAAFPARCIADAIAFNDKYELFKTATQTGVATEDKIVANNTVYTEVLDICKDGQKVFRSDAGKANLFVWNTVLDVITPPGSAGLKVTELIDETGLPGVGAEVLIQKQGDPVSQTKTVDADGVAEFTPLDPGRYRYVVTLAGRQTETGEKDVNAGTGARLEVRMKI